MRRLETTHFAISAAILSLVGQPASAQGTNVLIGAETHVLRDTPNSGVLAFGPFLGLRKGITRRLEAGVSATLAMDDPADSYTTSVLALATELTYRLDVAPTATVDRRLALGLAALRYSADPVETLRDPATQLPFFQYASGWDLAPSVSGAATWWLNRRVGVDASLRVMRPLRIGRGGYDGGGSIAPQFGLHMVWRN